MNILRQPFSANVSGHQTVGRIVQERFQALTFADDVIDSLQADESLDAQTKSLAIEIATTRGDIAFMLEKEAWSVVSDPNRNGDEYRVALQKAERACDVLPTSARYASTLGVAQYRVGQFERAIKTLNRAESLFASSGQGSHPRNVAFLAMAAYRLKRFDQANKELARTAKLLSEEAWQLDVDLRPFLHEAEQLIGTESSKTSSAASRAEAQG